MKVNKKLFCFALAAMALSSCNMDYNEYTAYDKEYIQRSFSYVGGLMTTIYTDIEIGRASCRERVCLYV